MAGELVEAVTEGELLPEGVAALGEEAVKGVKAPAVLEEGEFIAGVVLGDETTVAEAALERVGVVLGLEGVGVIVLEAVLGLVDDDEEVEGALEETTPGEVTEGVDPGDELGDDGLAAEPVGDAPGDAVVPAEPAGDVEAVPGVVAVPEDATGDASIPGNEPGDATYLAAAAEAATAAAAAADDDPARCTFNASAAV